MRTDHERTSTLDMRRFLCRGCSIPRAVLQMDGPGGNRDNGHGSVDRVDQRSCLPLLQPERTAISKLQGRGRERGRGPTANV